MGLFCFGGGCGPLTLGWTCGHAQNLCRRKGLALRGMCLKRPAYWVKQQQERFSILIVSNILLEQSWEFVPSNATSTLMTDSLMHPGLPPKPHNCSYTLSKWKVTVLVAQSRQTLLQPHGLQLSRLLCPWDSPGRNTGAGCHALLPGVFPIQGRHTLRCPTSWAHPTSMYYFLPKSPVSYIFPLSHSPALGTSARIHSSDVPSSVIPTRHSSRVGYSVFLICFLSLCPLFLFLIDLFRKSRLPLLFWSIIQWSDQVTSQLKNLKIPHFPTAVK